MCGIAGLYLREARSEGRTVHRMTDALAHRGPDGDGFVALSPGRPTASLFPTDTPDDHPARLFFGHRRLTIIDLEGSRQPLCNEDGTVWALFNGEIYNYRELRDELEGRGHVLREAGDTEVLVHLWEDRGPDMVDALVGMFAFAIYDTRADRLFLARDRFGQKPLYIWNRGGDIAFASELQALWAVPGFPHGETDPIAADAFFRYGYIPAPRTIYKGVEALPAGHWREIGPTGERTRQYWRPRVQGVEEVDLDALEARLDDAVRLRLRADVPLGAFLSGGIDSSLVVASMAQSLDRPVQTFTISTGESWCDESEVAGRIAAHLGTEHRVFEVEPDLIPVAERLARHYGQPFADFSSVPTYYVSRETRNHVKVALSGDGGDELFAGYERYRNASLTLALAHLPPGLRDAFARGGRALLPRRPLLGRCIDFLESASPLRDKGENAGQAFHRGWRRRLARPEFTELLRDVDGAELEHFRRLFDDAASPDPRERWLEVDQRMYLESDILAKVDVASMAVSLECRAPMLDHRFAEMANRIRFTDKLRNGRTKDALRRLAARRLPKEILDLPKKGFTLPLAGWLRGELADWAEATLFASSADHDRFLDRKKVRKLWDAHRRNREDHTLRLWILISWSLWRGAERAARSPSKP